MPNEQLKKEMVERGKGKIAKLIGRIAIYNDSKKADLCIVLIREKKYDDGKSRFYERNISDTTGFASLRI